MSKSIVELQTELQNKVKAAQAEAVEKAQRAQLEAQLGLLESPLYQQALVNQQRQQVSINRIEGMLEEAKAVIAAVPVYDSIRRQDKQWNGRVLYGHGIEFNNLYQLLSGIMYSSREHKQLLLEQTGLTESLIESTINAFGNTAYFSIRDGVIVDEVPFNIATLIANCTLIAATLSIELPMTELMEDKFVKRFETAKVRAEKEEAQYKLTQSMVGDTNYLMD
jgi:hypothetical protein